MRLESDLERLVATLNANGYTHVLKMPDGSLCGIASMIYTTGLVCGLDDTGWSRRYCYKKKQEAIEALLAWDGRGDPPGPWIKEKPSDRLGAGRNEHLMTEPLWCEVRGHYCRCHEFGGKRCDDFDDERLDGEEDTEDTSEDADE